MNLRFAIALLAGLAFAPFALPTAASADPAQAVEAVAVPAPIDAEAMQSCPKAGDNKLNMAQTSPADCCKGHKGVCGCRAGKIICCDEASFAPSSSYLHTLPTPAIKCRFSPLKSQSIANIFFLQKTLDETAQDRQTFIASQIRMPTHQHGALH